MNARTLLISIAVVLGLAALCAPFLLKGVPLPVRAATCVTSLLAAFALAMAARQRR